LKFKTLLKPGIRFLKYVIAIQLSLVALLLFKLFFWDVPRLKNHNPQTTAFIALHDGEVKQTWVPLSRISRHLAMGVVAAEDSRFYDHNGVDVDELKKSWQQNRKDGEYARGGSTIPMQLVKNLFLTPDKNVFRKGLEIFLAFKMDHDLSKERILEIYLNVVEWGDGIYGAEEAAKHYFKKSAAGLTSYEAAYLSAILPSPVSWGEYPPGPYVRRRVGIIQARMYTVPAPNLANLSPATEFRAKPQKAVSELPKSRPDKKTMLQPAPKTDSVVTSVANTPAVTAPAPSEPLSTPEPAAVPPSEETENFFLDDLE
jgi:monofunctional biosynthetic peptidoglycan transglycosylase